jgi:anti-sigma-K factor RskA
MENKSHNIETLLAGYALNALDPEQRTAVETHLDSCQACREKLAVYQAINEGLAYLPAPVNPPPSLRSQLIEKTTPAPSKRSQPKRWHSLRPRILQFSALAAILLLVVFNLILLRNLNQFIDSQENLAQQNQAYQAALALLSDPETLVAELDGEQANGTLIYDPDGDTAVLNVSGLKRLPPDQTYQVWLIKPTQERVSGGLFQASQEISQFVFHVIESPGPLREFNAVGVTIEPAGGSPGPTGPKIFGADL